MKTYVCDSCETIIGDPYEAQMKEFYYGVEYGYGYVLPVKTTRKQKLHLCINCYNNLKYIVERKKDKHGEWFLLDECANEGVYCSVCHKKVYKKDYANQKLKSPYCPNCGAKMDGGNKNDL